VASWFDAGFAATRDANVTGVTIVDFGVYTAKSLSSKRAKTPNGKIQWLRDFQLLQSTRVVCPRPGATFGFHYSVDGAPSGVEVPIRVGVRYPQGVRSPLTGVWVDHAEHVFPRNLGEVRFSDCSIDGAWDNVEGTWSIDLWWAHVELTEQDFELNRKACTES